MENPQEIYVVQVYDTQEHSLQTQAFRTAQGVMKCVADVKAQLDEMGGWMYEHSDANPWSFDAIDEDLDSDRKISVDVLEVWLND